MQINLTSKIAKSITLSFILFTPLIGQVVQNKVKCCGSLGSIIGRSTPSVSARISNTSSNSKPNRSTPRVIKTSLPTVNRSRTAKPLPRPVKVYHTRKISSPPAFRQSSAAARSVSTTPGFGRGGVGFRGVPCPPSTGPSTGLTRSTRSTRVSVRPPGGSISPTRGSTSSSRGSFSNSAPSPLTVYYVERQIKSIRVATVPDIERWEGAMRENMALKGRNRSKVNELLGRIRGHYQDDNIQAADYTPEGKGFVPTESTRKLAESRITRTVGSMAEFFEKSGNPEMDSSKSASGDSFLKGKLTFVNTELDKIGKPRITLGELKETISLKINGSVPQPEIIEDPLNFPEEIANEVPILDEKVIKQRVRSRYLAFAEWLASKEKAFPSLDPEVDERTMETFDLVNAELRGIGKFESMQIFREKTIAYLEDVLDGGIVPQADPFVAEKLRVGLPAEAEDRFEDEDRSVLFARPVRTSLPSAFQPSGLPLFSNPVLPGNPLDASPRVKLEDASGGSFSTPSSSSLPGKSWTPVRKTGMSSSTFEIRKLGSLPGTPI
jgi:hypothetical protein